MLRQPQVEKNTYCAIEYPSSILMNLLSIVNLTLFIFITAPDSDPRNYVLLALEDLVEDSKDNPAPEEVTNYIIFHLPMK